VPTTNFCKKVQQRYQTFQKKFAEVSEDFKKKSGRVCKLLKKMLSMVRHNFLMMPPYSSPVPTGAGAYCDGVVLPVRGAAGNAGNTEASLVGGCLRGGGGGLPEPPRAFAVGER